MTGCVIKPELRMYVRLHVTHLVCRVDIRAVVLNEVSCSLQLVRCSCLEEVVALSLTHRQNSFCDPHKLNNNALSDGPSVD